MCKFLGLFLVISALFWHLPKMAPGTHAHLLPLRYATVFSDVQISNLVDPNPQKCDYSILFKILIHKFWIWLWKSKTLTQNLWFWLGYLKLTWQKVKIWLGLWKFNSAFWNFDSQKWKLDSDCENLTRNIKVLTYKVKT